MPKYIDAEAFKRKLIDEKSFFPAMVARALEEMPDADVVEVVRCKDCKYGEVDDADFPDQYLCRHHGSVWNNGNHFCSDGERKDT